MMDVVGLPTAPVLDMWWHLVNLTERWTSCESWSLGNLSSLQTHLTIAR